MLAENKRKTEKARDLTNTFLLNPVNIHASKLAKNIAIINKINS